MKFKKLEVSGFKSFADKLEVKFSNGITAIVGPNGCGKSNVADSIRWVLGEQSAKLLRGSSMQDVIFNGTENRKSLSFCEVSLHFDNREKLFPSLEYDEVVISRKLYRSGESEYYINKTQCRLKDITDLLRDGGMGREGYSIIGQGRIDELLSAKPEDRRAIFEEAAGISKFKARKVDAERKLARTRDNLLRINDILEEKGRQLEPLTRQSEAARKWLGLRDQLKSYEINTYIHQYETANEAKEVINNRLNGVIEEIDLRDKECAAAVGNYNEAMYNINSVDKNIEGLREELLKLTVGIEKQTGEINLLKERLTYLFNQNERLTGENSRLDSDYNSNLLFVDEGNKARELKFTELQRAKSVYEEVNVKYLEVVDTIIEGEGEVEANRLAVMEAMDKLSDIKSNMSRLLAEKEGLTSLTADLNKRITAIKERMGENEHTAEELRKTIDVGSHDKKELLENIDALYADNNECVAAIADLATKLDGLTAKYHSVKTKHKMLSDMQTAHDAFNYSVKNLLNDAKTEKSVSDKIEGVVAKLIGVPPQFETAVETALGQAVQNIVTRTEEDAKYLIEYLKAKKLGRVTFLPMSSVKSRRLDLKFEDAAKGKGCFGVASRLVKFDDKYSNIIEGLLGNTVITDNIDTAISLARSTGYGFKIVTLDGEVINPQGSITGGSKRMDISNIFSHERELKESAEELTKLNQSIESLTAARDQKAKEKETVGENIRTVRDKIHALDVDLAAKIENFNKLTSGLEDAGREIFVLEQELKTDTARIYAIDKDINSVGELENIITTKKQSASESGIERSQHFEALKSEREKLHEMLTNTKINIGKFEHDLDTYDAEIKRLQANAISIAEKLELNNTQVLANNELIDNINTELNAFTNVSGENDSERVKEIRLKLSNLDEFKAEQQAAVTKWDEARNQIAAMLQSLHERKSREEMQLLKVDSDIEIMEQRVREEYELEYADCLQFRVENYDVTAGVNETNRIKRQMNALGHVNLEAIELCKEVFESYHDMDVQREDLVKGEADLLKIIKELSNQMLGMFTEKFETIRVNFVKIFKELFDGGNADLILLDNENPLEAGIEIVAQPPEKKLQSISLLSGGERALTAIAILFAILKLKPMPFCVLDEIEAALDDANASRFAKYLRRFSEETQFIVITHRKPTMELADYLYGVTMEEKGVSKIVSVKLSEAVNHAEPVSA